MRDRMEKFTLPFSIGCASQSSIAVGRSQPKKAQPEAPPPAPSTKDLSGESESQSGGKMRSSFPLAVLPGLQKIIKSFKNLSQIFVVYKEDDEEEMDMEIGFPTDVQHVAHIGWDGFNSVNTMKSWESRASEFIPIPSLSLRQFEIAMAAQADAPLGQCGPLGA